MHTRTLFQWWEEDTPARSSQFNNKHAGRESERSTLDYIASHVHEPGGTMDMPVDSDDVPIGLFYQDSEMKKAYENFPEIVFVNAIHKTNDKRMPLYVVLIEDSNGESEIVALLLCAGEDEATLQALFSRFNVNNESTTNTKVIVTDKDFVERKTLKTVFPCAVSTICLFHVLHTFKR